MTLVEGVSCQAVVLHKLASDAGVRMSFLDLDRGADLFNFFLRSSSMVTALLALPDDQARSVMGQVLETGSSKWIQLLIASPDPEDFLHGMYLPMDSRVLFLHLHADTLVVKEAYQVHQLGALLVHKLRVSPDELLSGFWTRRSDMHGFTLKATISNRNETDAVIMRITMTPGRFQVADFTYVYWKASVYAYLKWPTTSYVSDMRGFVAAMLATVVGATLMRCMTLWLLPERRVTKSSVAFDVLSAFCQQGVAGTQWFSRSSGCVVLVVTQLAGFLVFGIYSATLMSRLAVQDRIHSYEAFADLVNSTPYTVGFMRGDSSIEMTKSQLQKLNLHHYQLESKVEDIMERICEGNYIFVTDNSAFRREVTSYSADIASVVVGSSSLAFALKKNSPYLGAINNQLLKLLEIGYVTRLRKKWITAEPDAQQESESITMKHIAPCIVSLILGIATSAVCLLVEWRLGGENIWSRPRTGGLRI
ncbi:hypothetical protein PR048_033489 [Dryococelus australis]|uniref:Ionotropic glutamate receptor C-terminal domain-containing protein n=1 Tax=Dryococelus australis TaxID=614101 RepID=A0ABQ9G0F3_9NEOP|nr:hypothetical protein PR048_033489 [Dryococelus australis]